MNRIDGLVRLVSGALVCFGISGGIFFLLIWPELPTPGSMAESVIPWTELGTLFIFSFLWLVGGLIASYLLFGKLTDLTGHPEGDTKPWLAHREWAGPAIRSDILNQILVAWLFALVAISITIGYLLLARNLIAQGNFAPLLILTPFALVGLGMLYPAINLVRQWARFGQVTLTMDPYPGSIGGQVGGHADIHLPFDSTLHFQVHLVCERVRRVGRAPNRYTQTDVIWSAQGLARATSCSTGMRLGFRFDVPDDLPRSEVKSNNYHQWGVILTAQLPGIDLDREFDIPVFPTAESSIGIKFDSTEHSGYEQFSQSEAQSILKLNRDRDAGVILKYTIFNRHKLRAGLILLMIGLGSGLPGIAILMDETNVVGVMFSLCGLLFGSGGFYVLFHSMTVKANSMRLRVTLKLLGIPIRTREVARSEIEYLGVYNGQWIAAWKTEGKPITISQQFSSEKATKQALKSICDWTGYPTESKRNRREKRKRQGS